jgi:tetratricopeptide (TPR) repeat protein
MKRRLLTCVAACSWLAASAGPAAAEDPPEYTAAISEAVSEYQAGNFAESRALFERANALMPNARTLRGLGMVEFELRNYPASVDFLEKALISEVKPLDGDLRAETQRLLQRARGFVGRFEIALEPADATISVDGEQVALDANGGLVLAVGDHVLDTRAPGHSADHRKLRVTGGENTHLRVVLPSQAAVAPMAATPVAPPPATADRDDDTVLSSPWFWVAVGAVAIGAGVGVGLAVANQDTRSARNYGGDTAQVLSGP